MDAFLELARRAAERYGLEFEVLAAGRPLHVDPGSDFVREVLRLNDNGEAGTVCYGTDGSALTDLQNILLLGPDSISLAHTYNEWILLDQLERGSLLYAKLIRH